MIAIASGCGCTLTGASAVLVAVRIGVTVPGEVSLTTWAVACRAGLAGGITPGRWSALETPTVPAITAATAAAAASGGTQPGQRPPSAAKVTRRGRLRSA